MKKCRFMKSLFLIALYLWLIILCGVSNGVLSLNSAEGSVLFDEGFESGSPQTFLSLYYGNLGGSSRYSVQSAVKASGIYGLRYHFVAGTANVSEYATQHFADSLAAPVYPNGIGNRYNDIYVQFKLYYSPGYDWSAGNNKIMIIGTQDSRSHSNVCCNPWVSHYITILAGNTGERGFLNAEGNNKRSSSGQWFGLSPNVNGYNSTNKYYIDPGKWYTIEIHKKLNDAEQNNGIFEMWVDGSKVAEYYGVLYRVPWNGTYGSVFDYGTNFVMLTTYINNPSPKDQDIYYDDIKFSTTYIGATDAKPIAPTNLSIVDGVGSLSYIDLFSK